MEKPKFRLANIVGGIVFLSAFILNIQTNLDGETSIVHEAVAGSYGNGKYGDCVECYNDANWVSIVCFEMESSFCEATGCTSGMC